MDFIFSLDEETRSAFMRRILRILRWTYISLWSFDRQTAQLACTDGWYDREQEAGSSSMTESVGLRLFNAYRLCRFSPDAGVPGLAFNNVGFIWLAIRDILSLGSVESQRRFYMGAGIQTVVFIPCENGVIELGTTNLISADEQESISKLLTEDIFRGILRRDSQPASSLPMEQTRPSSSSSSLISLSIDSPDSSSLCTLASSYADQHKGTDDRDFQAYRTPLQAPRQFPSALVYGSSDYYTHLQSYLQLLQSPTSAISAQLLTGTTAIRESPFIVRDYTPSQQNTPDQPRPRSHIVQLRDPTSTTSEERSIVGSAYRTLQAPQTSVSTRPSAFRRWRPTTRPHVQTMLTSQYMFKRCITRLRNIRAETIRDILTSSSMQPGGDSSSQVRHMISERRRRLELNKSFQALRSLLPPGSRKDKASILAGTTDYLTSLRARVEELKQRNEQLESLLPGGRPGHAAVEEPQIEGDGSGINIREQEGGPQTISINDDVQITVEVSEISNTPNEVEIICLINRLHPSNTITDFIVALLSCIREMNLDLISVTSQKEASQYRSTVRITKPDEETRWDESKRKEVKDAILRALRDKS